MDAGGGTTTNTVVALPAHRMEGTAFEGEIEHTERLRGGGAIGVATDRFIVDRPKTEPLHVPFDQVKEIHEESIDWFLVIMSVLLFGFGVLSFERNLAGGVAFTLAGMGSLYFTYGRRGQVKITIENRAKPLTIYPRNVDRLKSALDPYVEGTAAWQE